MAVIQVIQRNAHLAGPVRYDMVEGRDGKVARAVFIAISNARRGAGDAREDEPTSIQWTVWGKQAENAARYLGSGSHVNVVGWVRNHRYEKDGVTVHGLDFTADEVDDLDTRAERKARTARAARSRSGPRRQQKSSSRWWRAPMTRTNSGVRMSKRRT